jgi:hypothetical protein
MISALQEKSSQDDFTIEARALGYHPFVRFSPLQYLALRELHGDWVFDDLLPRLDDPSLVYPQWAISFCAVAAGMSREELAAPANIYSLVTQAPSFKSRDEHMRSFQRAFKSIWRKVKAGTLDLSETGQSIARADYERWRALLAAGHNWGYEKRAKSSRNSVKPKLPVQKKKNRAAQDRTLVVIRNHGSQPPPKPASRNVWRNPRPGEPLVVRRHI